MERDWPTLVVGGLFFLLGVIFCGVAAWSGFGDRLEAARLESDGARTRAEVLRKFIVADRTQGSVVRPKYRVEYRFVPARGEPVAAEQDLEAALWRQLAKGDALEVTYLSADPSEHRVAGAAADWTVALIFGVLGGFFVPLGFWLARNGLRGRELQQPVRAQRWINDNPPLALGAIGLVFFLPFAAAGAWWAMFASDESAEFATRSQSVAGIVVEKAVVRRSSGSSSGGSRSSSTSTHYEVTYRYQAQNIEVRGKTELDSSEWDRLKERGPIAVTYIGTAPWKHRVGGEGGAWIGPAIFLGVGVLGMLGSGYAARRGWLRRGASPAPGPKPRPQPAKETPVAPGVPARRGGNGVLAAVGGVFFCAGSALAVSGLLDLIEERRFDADGLLVEARIVDKSIEEAQRGERRSTAYAVTYRFTTKEGRSADGRAVLKPDAWERAKPGDGLRVRYLPSRPETSRPQGESRWVDVIVAVAVGPLFALLGAGMLLGAWMAWRRYRG